MEWINAKERRPPFYETVLVIANGKPAKNITLEGAYELAGYSDDGWIFEMWPEWKGAEVTHWMPLPEPPEGVQHDICRECQENNG